MINIYFLNQDLGVKYTGIEGSALLRCRLFINQLGLIPSFVTYKYRSQLATDIKELKTKGKLPLEVKVINVYDFFQGLTARSEKTLSIYDEEFNIPLSGNSYQQYLDENGQVKASAVYNPVNQRLHYIVHFAQGKKWRRDYYHEGGSLSCTHFLDRTGKRVEQEIFYQSDGLICLIKNYSYQDNGVLSSTNIQIFDINGNIAARVDSDEGLIEYFLKHFLEKINGLSVLLIDKNRLFYQPAISIKNYFGSHKIRVIAAIHNLHAVNYHKKETSRINVNYVSVFENLSISDAVIVQTNIQKSDIVARFGDTGNVYAIPHTYENSHKRDDAITRNLLKAVYFARYNHDKKHELAIEAFVQVVKVLPEAEFHCYGSGSRLAELKEMVKTLEMEKNIFLHNWCDDVATEYESAALSIISSPSESFSLTIAESLAHGCPVVGFDVPYGPKELIQSGGNGYLVPYKDTTMMANKITMIMQDCKLQSRLSNAARVSAERFSENTVGKLWLKLFKDIDERSLSVK